MPIYEYRCPKCNHKFEVFQSLGSSNDSLNCPICGEAKPNRMFSVFGSAGINSSVSSSGCSSSGPFT